MKQTYLTQVSGIVKAHKIPPELVINWDQAGVKLIPSQSWTVEEQGSTHVEIAGINDKRCKMANNQTYRHTYVGSKTAEL